MEKLRRLITANSTLPRKTVSDLANNLVSKKINDIAIWTIEHEYKPVCEVTLRRIREIAGIKQPEVKLLGLFR